MLACFCSIAAGISLSGDLQTSRELKKCQTQSGLALRQLLHWHQFQVRSSTYTMRNVFTVRLSIFVTLSAALGAACSESPGGQEPVTTDMTMTDTTTSPMDTTATMGTTTSTMNTTATTGTTTSTMDDTSTMDTDETSSDDETTTGSGEPEPMTFEEVRAFLDTEINGSVPCFDCHHSGGDLPYVFKNDDTLYDTLMTTMISRCEDRTLVVPGDPDNSALYLVLEGDCGSVGKMPSGCYESADGVYNLCSSHEDRERLRLWIAAGAPE